LQSGKSGNGFAFEIPNTKLIYFEPNTSTANYLNDSFTLEFDFLYENNDAGFGITYPLPNQILSYGRYNGLGPEHRYGKDHTDTIDMHYNTPSPEKLDAWGAYPTFFDKTQWHHFACANYKNEVKGYLDQYRLVNFQKSKFHPHNFALQFYGPIKIKNFRLATGKKTSSFNKLLTDKKFVTHAIHFDVNKTEIKTESLAFIMQLAQFLKANPAVMLEIDGHTDSDGDAAANRQLSQARADEVRKQLITAGIDPERLTAKGFGASKPIQPNDTPKGKAENRRVEFVKR